MGGGLHLFVTPLAQATTLVAAVVCAAAAIWGRWPERAGALVTAVNWLASALLQDRHHGHHGPAYVFAADAAMLVAFLAVALSCRRAWVLWAAACSVLLNLTDFAMLLDERLHQWSYVSASYVWGMGVVVALAAGVALEGRRVVGPQPSWR